MPAERRADVPVSSSATMSLTCSGDLKLIGSAFAVHPATRPAVVVDEYARVKSCIVTLEDVVEETRLRGFYSTISGVPHPPAPDGSSVL